eukprot:UN26998
MYDGACGQDMFGYNYVKTDASGRLQVYYFEMINGGRNNWSKIMNCIEINHTIDKCTYLATKRFDGTSGPAPGPGPTPKPEPTPAPSPGPGTITRKMLSGGF